MNKLLSIAKNDLTIAFKEKGIWINLVIIPVVLIFIVGLVNGGFPSATLPKTLVDVFDADGTQSATRFLQAVRDLSTNVLLCPMDNDEADTCGLGDAPLDLALAQARAQNNRTRAIIEIPAGFETSLLRGEPTSIIYRSSENAAQPSILRQNIMAATTRMSGMTLATRTANFALAQNPNVPSERITALATGFYATANDFWQNPPIRIAYSLSGNVSTSSPSGFSQSVPGMGSLYVMFTVLAGVNSLLLDRKRWTLQRLVMMPVQRWHILGGKIISRFTLGMIQYSVAFAFGMILGVNFFDNALGILLVMVAFTLAMTALAFVLATMVKTDMQASSLTLMIALPIAMLGGAMWPLEIVPDFIKVVGFFTPMGWAMDGYSQLLIYGRGIDAILPHVGILLVIAGALFGWAILRFKYE